MMIGQSQLQLPFDFLCKIPLTHPGLRRVTVRSARKHRNRVAAAAEASTSQFVKPLKEFYPPLPCRVCKGTREVVCDKCGGLGSLARGGYHKKNPVDLDRIVGSKWTAMEKTLGWRHFEARAKQRLQGKEWFVEMMASCDENTRLWVNLQNLKDRERWSMGWRRRAELLAMNSDTGTQCKACKGEGKIQCRICHESVTTMSSAPQLDIIDI